MQMTVWRRHCNRYAFSPFRSFEQPQRFEAGVTWQGAPFAASVPVYCVTPQQRFLAHLVDGAESE
jgi:hypothetical protein